MNRAFSKILVLVILIVLAGGGIFAWQYFGGPEEEKKETKIENGEEAIVKDITDWNIYQNEKYGYEIKYPSELKIVETKYTPIEETTIMMWDFPSEISGVSASISVSVGPNSDGPLLSELIYDPNFCETEQDTLSAKIYCETNYRLLPVAGAAYQKDDNAFVILLLVNGPENLTKTDLVEEVNIYEEMLSTFKFIKLISTESKIESEPKEEEKFFNQVGTSPEIKGVGRNDQYRLMYVKMIGESALPIYFGQHQKYPTTLSELQYLISGDFNPLKDPASNEFFEYYPLLGGKDYQLCVNYDYDAVGKECYNAKDF